MLPKPEGEWGMPEEMVASLTGYGPDTEKNIGEAQGIMEKLGYSEAKPLQIKIQTRNLPTYRDPAVIVSDQLKKIHIVSELDILDTPRWYSKLSRKEYTIGLNVTGGQRRRSRRQYRRELFLQFRTQLHAILQRRGGQAAGSAVARARQGKAPDVRLGYRAYPGRGRRAAGDPAQLGRQLLATLCEELSSRTTTASTTICASRMCGWTNDLSQRHCEERSDEAIHVSATEKWIASLRLAMTDTLQLALPLDCPGRPA